MSDEKKPGIEKEYVEASTGIIHGSCCPETKRAFGDKDASGECPMKVLQERVAEAALNIARAAIPYTDDVDTAPSSSGPAQVATPAYRQNWETIFGAKKPVGQA